jgi:hypothetical protein
MENVLNLAIQKFEREYLSYSYLLKANHDDEPDIDLVLRYYFKSPGFVRMELIKPFAGTVIAYDPFRGTAHVMPMGIRGLVLDLSPNSRLIKGPQDHRVDESDVLTLLRTVKELARRGKVVLRKSGGKLILRVEGRKGYVVRKRINAFVLHLDSKRLFPIYAASYDEDGDLIEEVFFEDFRSGLSFEDGFFDLKKR